MRKVRFGVFETNSSSVHAFMSIPRGKTLTDFRHGLSVLVPEGPESGLPFDLIKKMVEFGEIDGVWDDYMDHKVNAYFLYLSDIAEYVKDKNIQAYMEMTTCKPEDRMKTFIKIRNREMWVGDRDNKWAGSEITCLDEIPMLEYHQLEKLPNDKFEINYNTWDWSNVYYDKEEK